LQCSRRIVLFSNQAKLSPGRPYASLSIGNSKDHNLVTPIPQASRQRGHRVDMSSSWKTKRAYPSHASHLFLLSKRPALRTLREHT
jgi:hypothetical protein